LVPDLHLIKFLLDIVFVSLNFLLFLLEFIELVVFYFDVDGDKDKFVAEISHTLDTSNSSLGMGDSSSLVATSS
jgi:hypothetical protein